MKILVSISQAGNTIDALGNKTLEISFDLDQTIAEVKQRLNTEEFKHLYLNLLLFTSKNIRSNVPLDDDRKLGDIWKIGESFKIVNNKSVRFLELYVIDSFTVLKKHTNAKYKTHVLKE
jgi:hypothetical protein